MHAHDPILVIVLAAITPACADPLPPLSPSESRRALSPTTALKVRCYDASVSKRDNRAVTLAFELQVNDRGQVHTELIASDADDPELIACMRRGFEAYDFPVRRQPSKFTLKFQLVPPRATKSALTPTLLE